MTGSTHAQRGNARSRRRFLHRRSARWVISAAGSLFASSAGALGLGDIDRQSALGEPLEVDIELSLEGGEAPDSVAARLGDEGAYARAGLDRSAALEGLSLSVIQRGARAFIHVTGRAPVREPYLPLLVEVASGRARVQHAYDLLLDPPQIAAIAPSTAAAAPVMAEAPPQSGGQASVATVPRHHRSPAGSRHENAGPLSVAAPEAPALVPLPASEEPPIPGLVQIRFSYALEGPIAAPAPRLRLSLHLESLPVPLPAGAKPAPVAAVAPEGAPGRGRYLMLIAALLAAIIAVRTWRTRGRLPPRESGRGPTASGASPAGSAMSAMLAVPLAATPPPPPAARTLVQDADRGAPCPADGFLLPERPILEEPEFAGSDFFSNVAEFLLQTLQREPQRRDLRMKLLEVYFAAGAADAYLEQAQEYACVIDLRDDPFWPEIARMGLELSPGQAFYESRPAPRLLPAASSPAAVAAPGKRRFYEGLDPARLDPELAKLSRHYGEAATDPEFQKGFRRDLRALLRRPSELKAAPRFSTRHGGALIYLKREDLHGAQDRELINAIGQIALAKYMGATRVVAGARHTGNHALAVARIAAKQGMRCEIFAGESTLASASVKLRALRELGAEVKLSWAADGGISDPRRAAMEAWLDDTDKTLFVSSLSTGPSPFPRIVLDLQTVVGQEVRRQLAAEKSRRRADAIIVNGEGGYETFGLLAPFLASKSTRLYGAIAVDAPLAVAEDDPVYGAEVRRLSREHAWLKGTGRVTARQTSYEAALRAVDELAQLDGVSVAIEDGYALACAADVAASMSANRTVVALMGATRS